MLDARLRAAVAKSACVVVDSTLVHEIVALWRQRIPKELPVAL